MAIVVEDGSGVEGANSYVSRSDFIAYANSHGIIVADTEDTDATLVKAAEFIDNHESKLKGSRAERDQSMSFPRTGVEIDGWSWGSDEIPRNVVLCQMALAIDIHGGIDPYNPPQNKVRTSERVEGAVSVSFAVNRSAKLTKNSKADALLRSLIRSSGMTVVRG